MNPKGVTVFLLLLPLLPHLNTSTVWAEDIITPKDFTFNLYLDKSTLVTYTVLVSPSQVNVNIPLPGSSYSDVLVSDINGAPLRFNVTKNSVSVLTLGTSSVSVNYLTNTLISSTDGLMAFNVTTNIPSTIILPKSSAMISTNVVPLEITTKDQQTTLVLPAGNLSLVFTSQSSPSDGQGRTLIQDLVLPLLIMVVLIIALTLLITKTKKSKRSIN
jgi:hypothetical protein